MKAKKNPQRNRRAGAIKLMKKSIRNKKEQSNHSKTKKEPSLVCGPHLSFVGLLRLDSLWARELGFFSSRTDELEKNGKSEREEMNLMYIPCDAQVLLTVISRARV